MNSYKISYSTLKITTHTQDPQLKILKTSIIKEWNYNQELLKNLLI